MKNFFTFVVVICLALSISHLVYAENKVVVKTVDPYVEKITSNKFVANTISIIKTIWSYVQAGWKKFRNWFSQLPGIKQYNESVYAGDNWKKEMKSMGNEMSPHLKKDSAGIKMLQEGKKKWDNL